MKVIQSLKSRLVRLPVTSGTDIAFDTLMIRGLTGTQPYGGVMIGGATDGSTAQLCSVGILAEKHDYAVNGSALAAGAAHSVVIAAATGAAWFAPMGGDSKIFPSRLIELIHGATLCRIDYDLTGTAATSSSGTTVTVASLEDDIDTGFLYCSSGASTSVGALRFIATSAAGSCTTGVSFGAGNQIATDNIAVIRPLLSYLQTFVIGTTTVGTKMGAIAAVGTGRATLLERHLVRNGADEMMDPYTHGNVSGLSSLAQFGMYGVFGLQGSIFTPIA